MEKQDQCCYVCGDIGYKIALVSCANCSEVSIHKYCLGIIPGSAEARGYVHWLCYYCEPKDTKTSDQISDNISTSDNNSTSDKTEIVLVEEDPQPLCTIFPGEIENPKEIASDVVLAVSPSGETVILDSTPILVKTGKRRSERILQRSSQVKRRKILQSSKGVAVC